MALEELQCALEKHQMAQDGSRKAVEELQTVDEL